jgi:ribulose-phosphate 3-epimerase
MHIAPSILAADFAHLAQQVRLTELGGADRVHVDVMDGHFVPNLSMGPVVVKGLRPATRLPLEVHLMVTDPLNYIDSFFKAGADSLIAHHEVLPDVQPFIQEVKARGKKVGMAINPGTPVDAMMPYLGDIDLALCMTVWPGFGGQSFLVESLDRIARLRELIRRLNPKCELEVDGGVDMTTCLECAKHGANVFVAGTALFGDPQGPTLATERMKSLVAGV